MSPPSGISNTELDVLKVLWNRGSGSVREIHEDLSATGKTWAYNTVQTLLNRLCAKDFLKAEKQGRAMNYSVLVSRDALVRQQLEGIADKVCDGSATPLVQSLFEGRRFSSSEIQDLRKLVEDLEAAEEPGGASENQDS